MEKPISFGELDFKIVASMSPAQSKPDPETPFRICIMGDFSGRSNRTIFEPTQAVKNHPPIEVDKDNIDALMERFGVAVHLPLAGFPTASVAVHCNELDDFHPEQLFAKMAVFKALKKTRERLLDAETFESTRRDVLSRTEAINSSLSSLPPLEKSSPFTNRQKPPDGSVLDQIVEESEHLHLNREASGNHSDWDVFLKGIVRPHLVAGENPEQDALVTSVDQSIADLMNHVLHDPDFQALESAWRAIRFLLYRMETSHRLKVFLLDLSKEELAAALRASDDLRKSGIYQLFVDQAKGTPVGEPWALLMGNYYFDKTFEDIETLGRMARIAEMSGAPFISAASAHFLGCENLADTPDPDDWKRPVDKHIDAAWETLRGLSKAPFLGLALPRFLLRLPYGSKTDPVESFAFEEMIAVPDHQHYLWGNPAFLCTLLLAQSFISFNGECEPRMHHDIEGLPLHVYEEQGENKIKPCAEVMLGQRAMEEILERGLMPLLSFKEQDRIKLARFQSVSKPATNLAGPWYGKIFEGK